MTAPQAAPGWYPTGDGEQRYWDGQAWTEHAAPPVQPTPPPSPSGSRPWLWGLVGVLVLGGVGLWWSGRPKSPAPAPVATTHSVTYRVTGTAASVDVTMATADGGTRQQSDVAVPMRTGTGADGINQTMRPGAQLYISAQNNGETGTVTCSIIVDGVKVSEVTSSGAYVIATCTGSL